MQHLPSALRERLNDYSFERVVLGESGATVVRCTAASRETLYLKSAPLDSGVELEQEAARMRWMAARGLPVPQVENYTCADDVEYLLTSAVRGTAASDTHWSSHAAAVVGALGKFLARLHRTGIDDCPFDHRAAREIERAWVRVLRGHVDADDFDEERRGRSPTDLFDELCARVPDHEDVVFTHGDFCPPNIILDRDRPGDVRVTGLIDCGRAGIADRHQDLALGMRSIAYNFGREWVTPFLEAYGMPAPVQAKVEFYLLLDEFF
ncbi:MAG TPA: APH(3') family aminoglycoside O-phosphotransferase [Gemmatimonadaceae bacterium]|nr:APH(3') family aminoglycoside O-phosphotransferase [Gemmatimonadaceae bacterium]